MPSSQSLEGDLAVQRGALDVDDRQRRSSQPGSHQARPAQQHQDRRHQRHPHEERVHEHADGQPERDRLDGADPPGMKATKTLIMISAAAVTTRRRGLEAAVHGLPRRPRCATYSSRIAETRNIS